MGRSIIVRFSYRTVVVPVFFIRSPRYALLVPDTTIVRVEFQLKFDLAAVARAGAESEAFQQRACRPVAWAGSRVGRSFGWPSPWASGRSVGKWRFGAVSFVTSRYMFGSHADSVAERPSQEPPWRSHSAPVAAAAVARGGSITAAERDCLNKNSETITPRTGNAIAAANAS